MKSILKIFTLFCLVAFNQANAAKFQISHLEPPFWWVGMKNSLLQILVHGQDISRLQPVIQYQGVTIEEIVRTENPNYIFMYLNISEAAQPGNFEIRFNSAKKTEIVFNYELKERREGSTTRNGYDNSDVMYLITPDRFANGNPQNDSVEGKLEKPNRQYEGGRHGGDIQGIANSLDYIQKMGYTAIWVNPVLENDMPAYSYHGYAATDFYNIDQRFGSNQEYVQLSKLAHEKGIKMIMDLILNHCGSEHWFVKDPPTKDWINFDGQYVNTNHRRNTIQDIHASEYDRKKFSDGWFVRTMPDMNQRNRLFADYLIQNSIWWIEYADLDGIRMDTYPYPDKNFMADWTCAVMNEYPGFNIVGEEWVNNPAIVSYWQRGKVNHDGYTSCLPGLMDFPNQEALVQGLRDKERTFGNGFVVMYEKLALDFLYPNPDNLVIFPDNHDVDRFYTQIGEDFDLYKMGMAWIATMRGIPQIFYGTEILMSNTGSNGNHGIIRSDFPGGWEGDEVNAFTGEGLTTTQAEAQKYMQRLLNWRKNKKVIHDGKLMQFAPEDGIYAYFRYDEKEIVMVVFNKNDQKTTINTAKFDELLKGYSKGKNVIDNQVYQMNDFSVPARSVLILEMEK